MRSSRATRLVLMGAALFFVVSFWVMAVPARATTPRPTSTCQDPTGTVSTTSVPTPGSATAAPAGGSAREGSSSPAGGLAFTGSDAKLELAAAGLLLGAGLLVILAARRRHRSKGALGLAAFPAGLVVLHSILPMTSQGCGPPAVLPESPFVILLPLMAAGVLVATWRISRRPNA